MTAEPAEAISPRPRAARGERPQFLAAPECEPLLAMVVALAAEVHRLEDRHERLLAALAEAGIALGPELRAGPGGAPRATALVGRVFRVLDEIAERALRGGDPAYAEIVDQLGRPERE